MIRLIKKICFTGLWMIFVMLIIKLIIPSLFDFYLSKLFYLTLMLSIASCTFLAGWRVKERLALKSWHRKRFYWMMAVCITIIFLSALNDIYFGFSFYFRLKNAVIFMFLAVILFFGGSIKEIFMSFPYLRHIKKAGDAKSPDLIFSSLSVGFFCVALYFLNPDFGGNITFFIIASAISSIFLINHFKRYI